MRTSTRFGVSYPLADRSDPPDIAIHLSNIVDGLEKAAYYSQGTFAARPAFGKAGRIYGATDTAPQKVYWDTGTSWFEIGALAAGAVGNTQLADASITNIKLVDGTILAAKIADGTITAVKITDGTITGAKLAAALKPSGGAGAATEALRALGTAAGMAAFGAHASQHLPGGADPLLFPMAYMVWRLGGGGFGAAPDANFRIFTSATLPTDLHNGASWATSSSLGTFSFPSAGTYLCCWGMDIPNAQSGTAGVFLSDSTSGLFVPGGGRSAINAGGDPSANITRSGINSGPRLYTPANLPHRLGGYWSGGSDVDIWVAAVKMPF